MKHLYKTAAAALGALTLLAAPAQANTRVEKGEARLAEMLEGRVAGEPRSCITAYRSTDLEVIPYVGIVYDAGDTIYVARAVHPHSLRPSDIPVFDRRGGSLCRMDVTRTIDRHHPHFFTGALFLEDFVPYTEARGG